MSQDMTESAREVNDIAPSAINEIVGQQSVIRQVEVALDAATNDDSKFENSLLVGPPGLGKSAFASVIAGAMGTQFIEVLGQSISTLATLHSLLLQAKERAVVHIDEAHELNKKLQTALYLALDKHVIFLKSRQGNLPRRIPLANFSLLLSTTDEYCLLQPLRDRMRLNLRFQFYSEDELIEILLSRIDSLGWDVDGSIPPSIARRSRGTPRIALRLLQSCRRVCRAVDESTIISDHLQTAFDLEQCDTLGLDVTEQAYLRELEEGPVRLNVIASILGLPAKTVSTVLEPYLLRRGLISKDNQARRELTQAGIVHINQRLECANV